MARKPIPDSGTLPVNVSGWLDELAALGRKNDEGHTARELAERAGVGVAVMRERLMRAQAAGRLVVGKRLMPRLDGLRVPVPVYRVLPGRPRK